MDPVFVVRPWAGGWGVFIGLDANTSAADEPFRTSGDAVAHAKELAKREPTGAQVRVYSENDKLLSEFFHQPEQRSALERDDAAATFAASRPARRRGPPQSRP